MTQAKQKPLEFEKPMTFEAFLKWDDGTERSFELVDGIPVPITEPNAKHEDVADELYRLLGNHCKENDLPYVPKRSKQVLLKEEEGKDKTRGGPDSRKADIVIFDKTEWKNLRLSPSSAAAYIAPPMIIEVASSNWHDDYVTKLDEYEILGVREYWIVDYAALGAIRYIGTPKMPTISIYWMKAENSEYQPAKQFRGSSLIKSSIFPNLQITADQVLTPGI